jgi:hypothetical protein
VPGFSADLRVQLALVGYARALGGQDHTRRGCRAAASPRSGHPLCQKAVCAASFPHLPPRVSNLPADIPERRNDDMRVPPAMFPVPPPIRTPCTMQVRGPSASTSKRNVRSTASSTRSFILAREVTGTSRFTLKPAWGAVDTHAGHSDHSACKSGRRLRWQRRFWCDRWPRRRRFGAQCTLDVRKLEKVRTRRA